MKPLLFLLILIFASTLSADQNLTKEEKKWSFRVAYGQSDKNDLGDIISFDPKQHPADTRAIDIDGGYLLSKNTWDVPLDFYAKAGISRFLENGYQPDFFEFTFYLKAFWNFHPGRETIRFGFGEGISYAMSIPYVERIEAQSKGDNNSYFLNYLDISLDIDIGRLFAYAPLKDTYFGYYLKHRSGIYGVINNVHHGGSNYDMLYIEHKF